MAAAADLVSIVEALYRLDLSPDEWLGDVAEVLRPLVDRHHLGVIGNFYHCPDPSSFVPGRSAVRDVPGTIVARFFSYLVEPHPTFIADSVLSRRCYFISRLPSVVDLRSVLDQLKASGAVDKLTLNALEPDGFGCNFGSFQASTSPLPAQASATLTRIARHLGAAHRLRHRFEKTAASTAAASAVMTPDGKMHHAIGVAKAPRHRAELSSAARSMDHARSRGRREDSLKAIEQWKTLVGQRWLLLDHVERDGRRFVLAVENTPACDGVDLLSPRERDVMHRLQSGQTIKTIAGELGLAQSTVRVLLMRAAAKVGARSRADLIEKATLSQTGNAASVTVEGRGPH